MSDVGAALPFSNHAVWGKFEQTYRRVATPSSDEMISVVHDGSQLLINTSGRHTESKTFELCSTYGLYVPHPAGNENGLIERILTDPYAIKKIGLDGVKDPDALCTVIANALNAFQSFTDIQVSARLVSDFWDNSVPLRDFVLSHNLTESGFVQRQTELRQINQRELPETVLRDEPPDGGEYRASEPPREKACISQ